MRLHYHLDSRPQIIATKEVRHHQPRLFQESRRQPKLTPCHETHQSQRSEHLFDQLTQEEERPARLTIATVRLSTLRNQVLQSGERGYRDRRTNFSVCL